MKEERKKTAFDGVIYVAKWYTAIILIIVFLSQFEKFINWIFELIK